MKFHEYRLFRSSDKLPKAWQRMQLQEFYGNVEAIMRSGSSPGKETSHRLCLEGGYVHCLRPFYNVYPAVERCLENTKLNLELKQLPALPEVVAMCFAEGSEPTLPYGKVRAMLVNFSYEFEVIQTGKQVRAPMLHLCTDLLYKDGSSASSLVTCGSPGLISDYVDMEEQRKLVSLAVGLILLAQDERFLEPVLLQQDQGRQLNAAELEKAIARAKKRGRNGMTIGKGLEVSPHTRMPHMAIRWTGTGRATPRLVPVKGCVVSRNKLFPVPTGYLDTQSSTQHQTEDQHGSDNAHAGPGG